MSAITLPESIEQGRNQYAMNWMFGCIHHLNMGHHDRVRAMIQGGVVYFGEIPTFLPNTTTVFPLWGIVRKLFSECRYYEIQLIANAYFAYPFEDQVISAYLIMANHQIQKAIQTDLLGTEEVLKTIELEQELFPWIGHKGRDRMGRSIEAIQAYLETIRGIEGV